MQTKMKTNGFKKKAGTQQNIAIAGGSGEARTPDHLIKSQMLYQLSYRPASGTFKVTKKAKNVNYIDFAFKKFSILFKYSYKIIRNIVKCSCSRRFKISSH